MSPEFVINLARQGVQSVLICAAPMLVVALLVGLLISIFQAATQINEQTMTFIPKIVAVFITMLIFGPWIMKILVTFTTGVFTGIADIGN
jgi:flagellar biosynthetic protein FliQ